MARSVQNKEILSNPTVKPLLSICIPSYNRGPFVEAQVRTILTSVLSNKKCDIELIVVNNKSTDDTAERLTRFSHPKMRVVHNEVHYDTAEE
ncbi:hypothetical protein DBR41_27975, partial [Pseudomonas sp. HMWF010]